MKMPKLSNENPYIEFSFSKSGKLSLSATSSWWGGINGGFIRSDGREGNTCDPKNLKKYIAAFKRKKINKIKKEISILESKLSKYANRTTKQRYIRAK